ncbi:hypothetical protein GOBAR_AA38562 [Gossypium barbadense]|uniref:Response regulatory domain-containing protein n=1 Tax=Gossypium barbadense TaxID=3634 RepID=A0A2P5VTI4_GOSBA|nr:hypothetical protein GOBAR_AA38562 [Gossypium barbadense]
MATTLHSNDQAPDKDNWDSGGLEHKRQLLTEFVFKNMMINLVGLLRSYGVQTLGVDNGRDAVDLIASGVKFDLIIIEKILPVLNGLDIREMEVVRCWGSQLAQEKVKGRHFWQLVLTYSLRNLWILGIWFPSQWNSMGSE